MIWRESYPRFRRNRYMSRGVGYIDRDEYIIEALDSPDDPSPIEIDEASTIDDAIDAFLSELSSALDYLVYYAAQMGADEEELEGIREAEMYEAYENVLHYLKEKGDYTHCLYHFWDELLYETERRDEPFPTDTPDLSPCYRVRKLTSQRYDLDIHDGHSLGPTESHTFDDLDEALDALEGEIYDRLYIMEDMLVEDASRSLSSIARSVAQAARYSLQRSEPFEISSEELMEMAFPNLDPDDAPLKFHIRLSEA